MPLGLLPCSRNLTQYKIRKKEKEKKCFTQFSTRIHWNRILDASKLFHINEVLYIPLSCMFECMFEKVCLSKYVWVRMFKYVCLSTDLWKRSFIKEKKWIVAPFSKFYGKTSVGFCPNTGKRFFWEISFWGQQKKRRCYWKTLLGIFKILLRFRDRHIFR